MSLKNCVGRKRRYDMKVRYRRYGMLGWAKSENRELCGGLSLVRDDVRDRNLRLDYPFREVVSQLR